MGVGIGFTSGLGPSRLSKQGVSLRGGVESVADPQMLSSPQDWRQVFRTGLWMARSSLTAAVVAVFSLIAVGCSADAENNSEKNSSSGDATALSTRSEVRRSGQQVYDDPAEIVSDMKGGGLTCVADGDVDTDDVRSVLQCTVTWDGGTETEVTVNTFVAEDEIDKFVRLSRIAFRGLDSSCAVYGENWAVWVPYSPAPYARSTCNEVQTILGGQRIGA